MRVMVYVLMVMMLCPLVLADVQFSPSESVICAVSGSSYPRCPTAVSYTLLPNESVVRNTSFTLRSEGSSVTVSVNVTFYYNDSSSYSSTSSTVSLTDLQFTIVNPNPGKVVDRITYNLTENAGSGSALKAYMTVLDFWTADPVPNLTINVRDMVTGLNVSGFCAVFSTGTNLTCTVGNGTSIIAQNSTGWNGENRSTNYARLMNSQSASGNVTRFAAIGDVYCAVHPWYTQSNYCTTAYFNTGCGISSPTFNYYCLVTDEISQRCLSVSMSQNASLENEALGCYNTIVMLNATPGGFGTLTEWTSPYDNRTGTPSITKNYTNDNAGDSDARFIISLFNTYNNPSFSNTSFKTAARTRARQMCLDFVQYNFVRTNKISNSNTSRNITYFPAGGANVSAQGITANGFMYSGYYGDYALALLACGVDTGNTTYYAIAQDVVENLLAASNWTTSSGFKVPPGRNFRWTSGSQPSAKCDVICNPDYIDDPDGKRLAKICGAERLYRDAGLTLHPNLAQYCSDWYSGVNGTHYAKEWYTNGTRKSNMVDDYDAQALATYLDMSQNITNAGYRLNLTGQKFVIGTNTFDSAACQGLYNPSFPIEVQGYLTSTASIITFGSSGENSCESGIADPVTYTKPGFILVLNSPINNSNVTSTSLDLSVTVYNTNVTSTLIPGWTTVDTDTFASTAEGWTGGDGVVNGRYNKSTSTGTFATIQKDYGITTSTVYNITFQLWWINDSNANDPKIFIGDSSGDDYILLDGTKASAQFKHVIDGAGYDTGSCGSEVFVDGDNITIYVNRSSNEWITYHNTKLCRAQTSGSITQSSSFQINQAESEIAIDNVYWRVNNYVSSGPATMNVSIYGSSGTLLKQQNDTTNGTTVTYTWNGLSGNKNWWVNVWSNNSRQDFGNFTFTIYEGSTNSSYCTVGNTITHNQTGSYNITIYNITAGNAAPVYFNATYANYSFQTTGKNYFRNLSIDTYQARIMLGANRIFFNDSIASFTSTIGLITNSTTTGTLPLPARNGSNNITVNVPGNYTATATCAVSTPLSTVYCNATEVHDHEITIRGVDAVRNTNITGFNVKVNSSGIGSGILYDRNTTGTSLVVPLLRGYTYGINFSNSSYALASTTKTPTNSSDAHTFTIYTQNSVNISFYDEERGTLLSNTTVFLELIGDVFSGNYSTTNGRMYIDLLIPTSYSIRYGAAGYATRFNYVTISSSSYNELNLTLLNYSSASNVTVYVYDEIGRPVEGALVKVLKFDVTTNTYPLNQVVRTNFEGRNNINVELNNEYYKFIIEYNGTVLYTSTPTYIFGETLTFRVTLADNAFSDYFTTTGLYGNITFNPTTRYATYVYSDPSNQATQGCLYLYASTTRTYSLINTTCTGGAAGSISMPVPNVTGTTYTLKGRVTINDVEQPVASYIVTTGESFPEGGKRTGLLILFMIMTVCAVIVPYSLPASMILAGLSVTLLSAVGLVAISLPVAISILVLSFVGAFLVGDRS